VSAKTSVQDMCGVAAGVNKIGVKRSMKRVIRAMQSSTSAGDNTPGVTWMFEPEVGEWESTVAPTMGAFDSDFRFGEGVETSIVEAGDKL